MEQYHRKVINVIAQQKMFDYVTKYDESITISTDGSADEEKIPFGWKICKKQDSEWGIIAHIIQVLREMEYDDDFEHVKGHHYMLGSTM
eukprot:15366968-Ditylum_brightwellii.AAC.1